LPDAPSTRDLTAALLAPLAERRPSTMTAATPVAGPARNLAAELAALAAESAGSGPFRLTDHDVRTALNPSPVPAASPFAWSARTARRALGLATVRALVSGDVRSPAEGVERAVAQASAVSQGRRPMSTMDGWLAHLPASGRAAVSAEAVTWATRLWSALDWAAFDETPVIGRDHWWESPHSSLLAIRGRAEVRADIGPDSRRRSTHLVVLGGPRRAGIRSELAVVALVEALRAGPAAAPGRVVGWWPDSGHLVRLDIDRRALDSGLAAIGRTLTASAASRTPGEGETRAAA
jgi:hypothetical protein